MTWRAPERMNWELRVTRILQEGTVRGNYESRDISDLIESRPTEEMLSWLGGRALADGLKENGEQDCVDDRSV
jgi:hypothetical protein